MAQSFCMRAHSFFKRVALGATILAAVMLVGGLVGAITAPTVPVSYGDAIALQGPPIGCPMRLERATSVPPEETAFALHGHLPTWFPDTVFGLDGTWSTTGVITSSWATWTDERCRSITVAYNPSNRGPTDWKLQYDKVDSCGDKSVRWGECIGYRVALPAGGSLGVQTIGLSSDEALHLVQSIPL